MPGAAHLQLSLSSGLSLLCLGVLLGCAMCRWHRRRPGRPLGRQRVELGAAPPAATVPVPVQQRRQQRAGEALGARAEEIPQGRASLPTLPFLPQLPGPRQRRCTIAGTEPPCPERGALVPAAPGSPPRLHCELRYSVPEATLTVTILAVSHLPRGHRGSRVKVALVPLSRRRSLRPARRCRFGPHGPEELRGCTLRFAVYSRSRSRRESFVGEVLFSCAEASWDPRAPSSYCWELASTKTKLSKLHGARALSCSVLSSPPQALSCSVLSSSPPALGRLLLLLQLQVPAGRIKVLLRKAEALARLSRLPGTPDHYIVIHLHHGGRIIDTKETKPVSGYSPVWNTPFLFSVPTGDTPQQELALEFIVMQARLHARGSALGRVQVGPGVPQAGMLHWRDMCSQAPLESERWHQIQPRPAP